MNMQDLNTTTMGSEDQAAQSSSQEHERNVQDLPSAQREANEASSGTNEVTDAEQSKEDSSKETVEETAPARSENTEANREEDNVNDTTECQPTENSTTRVPSQPVGHQAKVRSAMERLRSSAALIVIPSDESAEEKTPPATPKMGSDAQIKVSVPGNAKESIFGGKEDLETNTKVRKRLDANYSDSKRVKTNKSVEGTPQPTNQHTQNTAALLVGPQKVIIISEKDQLTKHSRYFRDAVSSNFSDSRAMAFPDELPQTINWFITWAYSDGDQLPDDAGPLLDPSLVHLYCFAEKIQCIRLKNDLIKQLYSIIKKQFYSSRSLGKLEELMIYVLPASIKFASNRLPDNSPLFQLLIALFVNFVPISKLESVGINPEHYPTPFRLLMFSHALGLGGSNVKWRFPRLQDYLEEV